VISGRSEGIPMRVGLPSRCSRFAHDFVARVGRIGAAPVDSNETALQRRLAVVLCAGTLPFTVLWSGIYLLAGVPHRRRDPGILFSLHPGQHRILRPDPQS
jgi:hypothetical protein